MKIGYARVSTEDQDLALQLDALERARVDRVFTDTASGARADRPGLAEALSHLRGGDVLVVWKLDRLGRTAGNLIALVDELKARGVGFASLTDGIDTTTTAGKFFFQVMAALAEMERDLLRERTRAGLEAARKRGRVGGRPRRMTRGKLADAKALLGAGRPPKDVAESLGVSVPTLYRWLPAAARNGGLDP